MGDCVSEWLSCCVRCEVGRWFWIEKTCSFLLVCLWRLFDNGLQGKRRPEP